MFEQLSSSERTLAIQRLTALWALNECGLGGILHALQSPFTGMLVGSIAMICIAMICSFAENKWKAVMTSLAIVLIIKATVSPHSTPTAYIAVIFQAMTGALIFRFVPGLLFGSILFVTMGLIESAIQRLLTLTILYGNTLWEAIDIWGQWVSDRWGLIIPVSSSRLIIGIYLGIHVVAGIFIGIMIYKIIHAIHRLWGESKYQLTLSKEDRIEISIAAKGKRKWKRYLLLIMLMLLIVFAYTINSTGSDIAKGLIAVMRAIAIVSAWFLFIAPLLLTILRKFLNRKQRQLSGQVSQTLDILPELLWIIRKSWKGTEHLYLLHRWRSFIIHSLLYILQYQSAHDPDPHRSNPKSQDHSTPEVV